MTTLYAWKKKLGKRGRQIKMKKLETPQPFRFGCQACGVCRAHPHGSSGSERDGEGLCYRGAGSSAGVQRVHAGAWVQHRYGDDKIWVDKLQKEVNLKTSGQQSYFLLDMMESEGEEEEEESDDDESAASAPF